MKLEDKSLFLTDFIFFVLLIVEQLFFILSQFYVRH